jgi:hypothetical protein
MSDRLARHRVIGRKIDGGKQRKAEMRAWFRERTRM